MLLSELVRDANLVIAKCGDIPVLAAIDEWRCVPASQLTLVEDYSDEVPFAVTIGYKLNGKTIP